MSDANMELTSTGGRAGRSDTPDKAHFNRNGNNVTEHPSSHKPHYRPPTHLSRDPT